MGRLARASPAGSRALGLERGERVGIYLDKRLETVVSIFGTSAAGGVFVPVNPVLRPQQVAYILADCGVRVLVTTRGAAASCCATELDAASRSST